MATFSSRIINKAASLITPLASRNYSSLVLINTPLKNSLKNSYSIPYREVVSTPTLRFSSLAKKRPTSSDQIICIAEAHDLDTVIVETPSEFPFKIEDKPENQTITLTRRYRGDDIKVIVHMPAPHSSTLEESGDELDGHNNDQRHKDNVGDPQSSSIRLVVNATSYFGTMLEYGVIAYPDDFSVDSFCIKYAHAPDENIYYKGPDYAKLDMNLHKEFKRRLKIRGIIPSTTNFLHKYMANRDVYPSADSSNSPLPTTTATNDQYTHESILPPCFNDEGILVEHVVEQYRQRGHPLVSAEDIRNSGKNHNDFVWIPYLETRSEKLLWIEVPREGFYANESELGCELELDDSSFIIDEEDENPYRCLPFKMLGDTHVFSEEMDKILYPDVQPWIITDAAEAWEESRIALKAHNDEMVKIKYPNGRNVLSDEYLEWYQVNCM